MRRNIFATIILGLFVINSGISQQETGTISTTYKIKELIDMINRMYVEKVDETELKINLIKGMHNRYSPFQAYQEKGKIAHLEEVGPAEGLDGIGIAFKFKGDTLLVEDVIAGSGAETAGIEKGDKILKVGEESIDDFYYYVDVTRALVGKSGSSIQLTLAEGESTKEVDVMRKPISGFQLTVLGDENNEHAVNDYKKALQYFDAVYADSVTNTKIVEFGIRYMLEQLDPHSAYISLEDLHDMNAPLKGSFTGVGVRFQIVKDTITVVQAIPGGPSEKVGIQAGDQFIYIEEENVAGTSIKNSGVRERLLGDKGTKVHVKMRRRGESDLIDFTIERDKIPIYSLDASYMAAPKVGYIKLNNFSATTVAEVHKAIDELKRDGMKDLVLDLQSNGGGYLMTAVHLADEFLKGEKLVVYTEGRAYRKNDYGTRNFSDFEEGRLIVLVNESSASASEIVSGAIQDWDRGLIVGRRTFGKGLVQKPINLSDGSQVRITTQRYYTPSGRCIQKPYDEGSLAYRREKYQRYENGESFNKDSIHFNDSLKYETKLKNRTVYGGGGIMPDVFVPLDTTGTSEYYSQLVRKGIMNRFALTWVNDNRKSLQEKYPTFKKFKKDFNVDKLTKSLFKYAEKEGLEFNKEQYEEAESTIKIRLKANIAQNLYDYRRFYEIINDLNPALQKALDMLEQGEEFKQLSAN